MDINRWHHTIWSAKAFFPVVRIGSAFPSAASECVAPPTPFGSKGEGHSLAERGRGEPIHTKGHTPVLEYCTYWNTVV